MEFMTAHKPQIILASASPRREQLLREIGLRFTVVHPDNVEEVFTGATPEVLAMRNAQCKAHAVAERHRAALVIGADTMVVLGGKLFGKPRDPAEAGRMLAELAGQKHEVFTGVCLVHRAQNVEITFCDSTKVWMKPLTREGIHVYHSKIYPLDKAGAYAAQEHGDTIIKHIDGSFSNVMGLPIERLRVILEKLLQL
jgi:septum formation protein